VSGAGTVYTFKSNKRTIIMHKLTNELSVVACNDSLSIGHTIKDISGQWFGYPEATIPAGTAVAKTSGLLACSVKLYISDLSWIPRLGNGEKQYGFIHDATFYGIYVSVDDVAIDETNCQLRLV